MFPVVIPSQVLVFDSKFFDKTSSVTILMEKTRELCAALNSQPRVKEAVLVIPENWLATMSLQIKVVYNGSHTKKSYSVKVDDKGVFSWTREQDPSDFENIFKHMQEEILRQMFGGKGFWN